MKAQGVGPLRLPRRSRLAGRVCSRPRAWGRRTAYVQATSRAQSGAQRGIIFFAATEVRILPARHIEQPRRHAVHPCAPAMPGEILAAAARWQRRSPDANCLCRAVSAKSAGIPRQYARILIPTDSPVRVRPPQPRSRSLRRRRPSRSLCLKSPVRETGPRGLWSDVFRVLALDRALTVRPAMLRLNGARRRHCQVGPALWRYRGLTSG
jgi:hypothetical protein